MSFETVLASERVYEGRILNLRVDEIRTPNGVEALREIVENSGAVAMVALDDQQRVVLVKQYRHALRGLVIEIPAGKLDGDERRNECDDGGKGKEIDACREGQAEKDPRQRIGAPTAFAIKNIERKPESDEQRNVSECVYSEIMRLLNVENTCGKQ